METRLWRKIRQGVLIVLLVGLFFQASLPPAAQAATQSPLASAVSLSPSQANIPTFNQGDLLVAAYSGPLERIDPTTGAVLQALNDQGDEQEAAMCFDGLGQLYVTNLSLGTVSQFDASGTLLNASFISGLNAPLSCAVDVIHQYLYIGTNTTNSSAGLAPGQIYRYDLSGNLLAIFSPDIDSDGGMAGMNLGKDDCTVYYTAIIPVIKRFNVCTNSQLPDLTPSLPNSFGCTNIRLLSNGQLLVACQGLSSQVYLLNSDGSIAQTYPGANYTANAFDLDWVTPDPSGSSFWAAGAGSTTGVVYHIDLATGNLLGSIQTNVDVAGIAIVGASGSSTSLVHPIIFVHGLGANSNDIGTEQNNPAKNQFVPLYAELESVYGTGSVTTFAYVDDRSIKDNAPNQQCPAGLYPPCASQSSVDANALALSKEVKKLSTQTNHTVALIGYSMGGSIIRTLLAGCPDAQGTLNCPDAPGMVDSAFFLGTVQQGSWLLKYKRGSDAVGAIPILGKAANLLASGIYKLFGKVTGFNPGYPAYTDLQPQSANILAHNSTLPPANINYFNFYSDIQIQLSVKILPFWTIPLGTLPLGDLVLLRGDDNPLASPKWGGARFCLNCGNLDQYNSVQRYAEWPLVRVVPFTLTDNILDLLTDVLQLPELHTSLFTDSALDGGIQVQDSTGQGGSTSIAREILLQLEREDGIFS